MPNSPDVYLTDSAVAGKNGLGRVAHYITEGLSPLILVAAISVIVAWHSGSTGWGIVTAVFASGIPLSYIIRGIRQGKYHDHHINSRERRPAVILFSAASVLVGLLLMLFFDAPRQLVALVVAMLAGLALTLAVTYFWKVSFHSAVAAGAATIMVLVFGGWALAAWIVVAAIGWSRIYLRSHTLAQVIVGWGLGALAAGGVFPLLA